MNFAKFQIKTTKLKHRNKNKEREKEMWVERVQLEQKCEMRGNPKKNPAEHMRACMQPQ